MVKDTLEHNKKFVDLEEYKPLITTKYPDKKIAILTCMDTRLIELLPAAIGVKNGDVKILKNAGGIISHPYGSVIRSLIIAIYSLEVDTIWVIGHTDCGMENMDVDVLVEKMIGRGVDKKVIDVIAHTGVDLRKWLGGFDCAEATVRDSMNQILNHPLIPKDINVEGFIMDSTTGRLAHLER